MLKESGALWEINGLRLSLVTPEEFAEIPDGRELYTITGLRIVKGVDRIDNDTRGGYLAYGFKL